MACLCLVEDLKLSVFCVFLCSEFGFDPLIVRAPEYWLVDWRQNNPKIIPKPDGQVKPVQGIGTTSTNDFRIGVTTRCSKPCINTLRMTRIWKTSYWIARLYERIRVPQELHKKAEAKLPRLLGIAEEGSAPKSMPM